MVDKTFLHRDNESGGCLVHGEPSVDVFSWSSSCRTNVDLFLGSKGPRLLTFSDNTELHYFWVELCVVFAHTV